MLFLLHPSDLSAFLSIFYTPTESPSSTKNITLPCTPVFDQFLPSVELGIATYAMKWIWPNIICGAMRSSHLDFTPVLILLTSVELILIYSNVCEWKISPGIKGVTPNLTDISEGSVWLCEYRLWWARQPTFSISLLFGVGVSTTMLC